MKNLSIRTEKNEQYAVITPMRNEVRTVQHTVDSMLAQSRLPGVWIVMDDGSTDGSEKIIEKYSLLHEWIVHVKLNDRGFDFVGKGVADILNKALDVLQTRDQAFEFIAKLDADMEFPPDYFEKLIGEFKSNTALGIVSGHPYVISNNKKQFERHSDYFPSGTARLYRAEYLNRIGYFASSVGWDTIDILRMRMNRYVTKVRSDMPIHHMRRMGTRQGYVDGMIRDGRNAYLTGYAPWFMVLRAIFNARYYPYLVRSACMLYGYFKTYFSGAKRAVTQEEYEFHTQLQKNRILRRGTNAS